MDTIDRYSATPLGSLSTRTLEEENQFLDNLNKLPTRLRDMLSSFKTGSYLSGLIKTNKLPEKLTAQLAYHVLRTGYGMQGFSGIEDGLKKLGVPEDKAKVITTDIERNLFAPISMEYNQYLRERKTVPKKAGPAKPTDGMSNVLDLKLPSPGDKPTSSGHKFT
jgi:hypothetical protein